MLSTKIDLALKITGMVLFVILYLCQHNHLTACWVNISADDILTIFFLFFPETRFCNFMEIVDVFLIFSQKIGFEIPLSP